MSFQRAGFPTFSSGHESTIHRDVAVERVRHAISFLQFSYANCSQTSWSLKIRWTYVSFPLIWPIDGDSRIIAKSCQILFALGNGPVLISVQILLRLSAVHLMFSRQLQVPEGSTCGSHGVCRRVTLVSFYAYRTALVKFSNFERGIIYCHYRLGRAGLQRTRNESFPEKLHCDGGIKTSAPQNPLSEDGGKPQIGWRGR